MVKAALILAAVLAVAAAAVLAAPRGSDFNRRGFCLPCSIPWNVHCHRSSERTAASSLLTIVAAQEDYRAHDRDGNGRNDYWRGDVAGLYAIYLPGSYEGIKLIELSVAGADASPLVDVAAFATPSPKAGYWFRALRHAEETTRGPDRFAACAFPDSASAGRWTYVVDERKVVWKRELGGGRGVEVFPSDRELENEWRTAR